LEAQSAVDDAKRYQQPAEPQMYLRKDADAWIADAVEMVRETAQWLQADETQQHETDDRMVAVELQE
jgi:hypothetical protein